jgi:hypothetical protein
MVPDVEVEQVGWRTEEELLAAVSPDPLPEVFITVQDYMERNGCCHSSALRDLQAAIDAGILHRRRARLDGRERWIFY